MQNGNADNTSNTECCFKNKVERQIKIATTTNPTLHHFDLMDLVYSAASITASEPIT